MLKEFESNAADFELSNKQQQAEILREAFTIQFNKEKLKQLTLEEYALGLGNKDGFCYWLEEKLAITGNIHGSTSHKFAVYFGKTNTDPEQKWRWVLWTKGDFNLVRNALVELYEAGEIADIAKIKANPISPMFKGKILNTYFPDKYLNVFSDYHLRYFLNKLDIKYHSTSDTVELRQLLIEYKNSKSVFSKWSATKFGMYLYSFFGSPSEKEIYDEKTIKEECYDVIERREINDIVSFKEYCDKPISKIEYTDTIIGRIYKRNSEYAAYALLKADFCCEVEKSHETFMRRNGKYKYTEAHHLIPMSFQDEFEYSLDVPANIVSLCSHCHNLIHYGQNYETLLLSIYNKRLPRLKEAGLEITFSDLKKYYK